MKKLLFILNPKYFICLFVLSFLYGYFEAHNDLGLTFTENLIIMFIYAVVMGLIMFIFFKDAPVAPATALVVLIVSIYDLYTYHSPGNDYVDIVLIIVSLGSFIYWTKKYYSKDDDYDDGDDGDEGSAE